MKLVVLSDPEWIKYPFIVHRHLNAALEFAQALGEPMSIGYLEGYETGAVRHAIDWHLRRFLTRGYEDVHGSLIYANERWMFNDSPQLVLAFMGPGDLEPSGEATKAFQLAQRYTIEGTWVKWVDLPEADPKDPKDVPSAMDVLHGKLAA